MSNCVWVDDGEPCAAYTQKLRRAAKEHRCDECGDSIGIGDLYEYFSGVWDGSWSTYKTCARCCNVRKDYFQNWTFSMLVEDFDAAFGFDYRDGIPADFTPCGRTAEGEET